MDNYKDYTVYSWNLNFSYLIYFHPSGQIESIAKKEKVDCRAISMGQGQEIHARRLLLTSMGKYRDKH